MDLSAVEAVELWETHRGFSKPCGKAAEGRLSIGRQIHSLCGCQAPSYVWVPGTELRSCEA